MTDATRTIETQLAVSRPADVPAPTASAELEGMIRDLLGPAYGVALRLTGNRQDAEDLLQEAALGALRGYATFRQGSNFKAWFFRILVNCFYAAHRKFRAAMSIEDVEDAYGMFLYDRTSQSGLVARGDPVDATIGRLASEDIGKALASLPEEYRTACTMYFMDDLSYEEIADMLGVPLGTVRSRLHRGRRMLQKRLWTLAVDQGIVTDAATTRGRE